MSVPLRTDIADPLKRLAAIRDYTVEAKEAKAGVSARIMTDLSQHIPGATMAAVARILTSERFAVRGTNLFISNVPGAQVPLYLAGAQLVQQYGAGPLANNMGLFIATPSYNGQVGFSIISERAIMPDIAFFRTCIDESFADLLAAQPKPEKAAAGPKAATAKPKAAAKPAAKAKPTAKPATKGRAKPVAKAAASGKNRKK